MISVGKTSTWALARPACTDRKFAPRNLFFSCYRELWAYVPLWGAHMLVFSMEITLYVPLLLGLRPPMGPCEQYCRLLSLRLSSIKIARPATYHSPLLVSQRRYSHKDLGV